MEGTHQMMGYDRASTMFSPDGRLLQVEYAKEAVKQGSTAIGVVCKDGVILIADKRVADKLIEFVFNKRDIFLKKKKKRLKKNFFFAKAEKKIFQVDKHIGATATGYI